VTTLGTREVGRTGLRVTTLGFGGASIGNLYREVDDDTARAAVDAAWEAGIRYFDTAPHYGLGLSERRLGAALRDRPRDEYVLSTKVGRLLVPNEHPTGSDMAHQFAVPDRLRRELEAARAQIFEMTEQLADAREELDAVPRAQTASCSPTATPSSHAAAAVLKARRDKGDRS
jgi:D-threo-aldose 1-dehydrogenase